MTRIFYFLSAWMLLAIACLPALRAQSLSAEIEAIADIVVDPSGNGDFTTVQEALWACPDSSNDWTVVFVKKGTYYEKVILNHKKTHVVLVGEDVDSTIITYDDYGDKMLPGGHTFSTYSFRADPHDFQAYNITFQNTSTAGQAVAFHSNGDRQILFHCKLLSYQDTYFDNFRTRRYMKDCFIEGAVDYIFGFGVTLFDSCQIHSISNGYITAASTPQYYEFGYVFKDCWLTTPEGAFLNVFLGRPWFPYSNTVFFECWQTSRINPRGWENWDNRGVTAKYYEYNCWGPGYRPDNRISWSNQLDSSLAWRYNIDTIFAASNFPSDSGRFVDSMELWSMRDRFEASGYADRADTILYAGRDTFPEYPTDDWSPVFYDTVYNIIRTYTEPFGASVVLNAGIDQELMEKFQIRVFSPMEETLMLSSGETILQQATLSLYDLDGRQVFSAEIPAIREGIQSISVESAGLTPGVYLYQIETSEYRFGGKVMKQ